MAPKAKTTTKVTGQTFATPVGKALFVSAPAASSYDATKQEASILLDSAAVAELTTKLQAFMDSPEVQASGIKDTGFVAALFKEDTDQDGNPTGLMRLKAKTGMQFPAKLLDAAGKEFKPSPGFSIPNRSSIRISCYPEVMETSMFKGIVLRLKAIKIISTPSFSDGFEDTGVEGDFSYDSGTSYGAADSAADAADGWGE